jgi:CspA family cold shock protein
MVGADMATGRIVEFDAVTGYGLITPDNVGSPVLFHAEELGGRRDLLGGTRVKFSCISGARGPKAYNVILLAPRTAGSVSSSIPGDHYAESVDSPEVVSSDQYEEDVTDILIVTLPGITAAEIVEIRTQLTMYAGRRGWLNELSEHLPA